MRGKYLWSIRIPLLLAVLAMLCGITSGAAEKVYNGRWWLSASAEEQDGFLNGYFDCYKYDYRGPDHFTQNPPDTARALITRFYDRNSTQVGMSVPEVFHRFRDRPGETVTGAGGEPIRGRHGYYDGDYWRIQSAKGQIGYVEGYLWCWERCLHDKEATFSKPPKTYVSLIDKWYGFNPDTGDIALDHEYDKIADVLFKFRDGAPPDR